MGLSLTGWRVVPGLFVSIGLPLTFLGLISALNQMGMTGNDTNAMRDLMTIASAKFIMSLAGLLDPLYTGPAPRAVDPRRWGPQPFRRRGTPPELPELRPRSALNDSLSAINAALGRFVEIAARHDQMDAQLGRAFETFRDQVQSSVRVVQDHSNNVHQKYAEALDTLRTVVDQAESFVPERRVG